jgi:hypothetical protein
MTFLFVTVTLINCSLGQRILTSVPISIESIEYRFPGNSHGCGQITSSGLLELTVDMSKNDCGGGTVQCPRCFMFHHAIRLSIKSCHSPPRTTRCQETGQCPPVESFEQDHRLSEYLFINLSGDPVFVGSDSIEFATKYPKDIEGSSDSVAIGPNSARTALCYQGRFYWPN